MITDFALPNFKLTDFMCHCGDCAHDPNRPHSRPEVMGAVQAIRDRVGQPVRVSRGVSCEAHNKSVGGARDSRHLPHHADGIDIVIADAQERAHVLSAALALNFFTMIILYDRHIHMDPRPGPKKVIFAPGSKGDA